MGQPSLIAKLGIDEADFTRGLNASETRLSQTQEKAKLLAAQIALLQGEMAKENNGKGTQAQVSQYKELESTLRNTRKEAVEMKRNLDALQTVKVDAAAKAAAESGPVKVTPQTILRGSSSSSAAPVKVVLPEPKSPKPRGPAAPPKPNEPEDEPNEASETNNRMRNMELGHVARATFDSLAAGQSLGRTAMQEGPRLLQAFRSSIGTVVKWLGPLGLSAGAAAIGVGAAVKVLTSAHEEAVQLTEQIDKSGRPQASLGGDTQEAARARLESTTDPIAKLQEKADSGVGNFLSNLSESITDKVRPATQAVAAFYNKIYEVVGLGGKLDAGGFILDKGTSRETALEQAKAQQAVALNRYAATQMRDNVLDEKGFSQGEDRVANEKLERLFKQRKDAIEKLVAENPAIGDSELIKGLREEINLREKITTLANENAVARRADQRDQVFINHPGMSASESNSAKGEPVDPAGKMFQTPIGMMGVHSIAAATVHYNSTQADLARVRAAGGDDRAASDAALRAEAALQDATVSRSLMRPEEQNEADRKQLKRDQAAERFSHPGTRDVARDGSAINDVDKSVSNIPDASLGMGATDSPDNAMHGVMHMPAPTHMPDRSFVLPNRMPGIEAGAQNAGKGDVPKISTAGIESRLDKIVANTSKLSFQNKA